MRGRPPKYFTEKEHQEARRQASQKYRARQAKMLQDALERIEELEIELDLLRARNERRSDRGIRDSNSSRIEEKLD
jgi:hypothetical protein